MSSTPLNSEGMCVRCCERVYSNEDHGPDVCEKIEVYLYQDYPDDLHYRKMKFSLDFDGTTWQHQDFFRTFMRAMQACGHEVGMLTGHYQSSEERDIQKMLDRGFPRPDFYIGRPDGSKWHGGSYKPRMIEKHNIDYHFDDCDYSQPKCLELMGKHPRLMRCWNDPPKATKIDLPPLPPLPPVYPPGCDE